MKSLIKLSRRVIFTLLLLLVVLIALRWHFWTGAYLTPDSFQPNKDIIDLHVHTACLDEDKTGCFISDNLRNSYKFGHYLASFNTTEEELAKFGDEIVVEKLAALVRDSKYLSHAVILSLDGVINDSGELDRGITEFYVPPAFVASATAKYPELLYATSVNPKRSDALERLEEAKSQGAVLVKWLPAIQLFDPASEKFTEFYQKLVELDLPLLTHTGHERAFSHAINEYADPMRLKLALDTGVKVIAAHAASTGTNEGERNSERLFRLMQDYPNLFTEISSLTQINKYGYLKEVLNQEALLDRVAYSSDMPLINTPLVSPFYYPLELSLAKMRKINSVANPFDRNIELMKALGVPKRMFDLAAELINK